MTLYVSKQYVDIVHHDAELLAARRLGIPDPEYFPVDTLKERIREVSPVVASSLDRYYEALRAWYQFHVAVDAAGSAGHLSAQESVRLAEVSNALDASRAAVVGAVDNY